jgi:hypothetical protein
MNWRTALLSTIALGFAFASPSEAGRIGWFPQWAPLAVGKMCVPSEDNSVNVHCFFTANRKDSFLITQEVDDVSKGAADLAAEFCVATGFRKDRASMPLDIDVRPGSKSGTFMVGLRSLYCETPRGM